MRSLLWNRCVGAIVGLVIEAVAFAFGFLWAFVWLVFLKPAGRFLHKVCLLTPVSLALVVLVSFWLMYNDLLNGTLAALSFVGGVLALCGLIAWFVFDVLAGLRND